MGPTWPVATRVSRGVAKSDERLGRYREARSSARSRKKGKRRRDEKEEDEKEEDEKEEEEEEDEEEAGDDWSMVVVGLRS